MKKIYLRPAISVLDIETENLMAASANTDGSTGSVDMYADEEISVGMSKGHSFDIWGDDEED